MRGRPATPPPPPAHAHAAWPALVAGAAASPHSGHASASPSPSASSSASASPSSSVHSSPRPRGGDADADGDDDPSSWESFASPSPFAVSSSSAAWSWPGRGSFFWSSWHIPFFGASSTASVFCHRGRSLRTLCLCLVVVVWLLWSILAPTITHNTTMPTSKITQQTEIQHTNTEDNTNTRSETTATAMTAEAAAAASEAEQLSLVQLPLRNTLPTLGSSSSIGAGSEATPAAAAAAAAGVPPGPLLLRSLRGQVYESAEAFALCALRPGGKEVEDAACKDAASAWARMRGSQRPIRPAAIDDDTALSDPAAAAVASEVQPPPLVLPSCFVQSGVQGLGAFRQAVAPSLHADTDAGTDGAEGSTSLLHLDRVDYASGTLLATKDQGAVTPRPFLSYGELRKSMMQARQTQQQTDNSPDRSSAASSAAPSSPSSSVSSPSSPSPIRVLFVTDELSDSGLSMTRLPYGGAGTAIYLLARTLAAAGSASSPSSTSTSSSPPPSSSAVVRFDVHILHVTLHALSGAEQATAVATLASVGITLHVLPPFIHGMRQENYFSARTSYAVLLFLMQYESGGYLPPGAAVAAESPAAGTALGAPFHVVHMSDFNGFAYHSLQARRQGWAFRHTSFVLTCHGSSSWAKAANEAYPRASEELETAFMERRSIESAQALLSPSNYMLQWMRARNWQLPTITAVIPNMQPDTADNTKEAKAVGAQSGQIDEQNAAAAADAAAGAKGAADVASAVAVAPPCEVVFFGRLEHRKGLSLFLDAMERLVEEGAAAASDGTSGGSAQRTQIRRFRLTFLGRELRDSVTGVGAHELIRSRVARWRTLAAASPSSVPLLRFIPDASRTFALAYLSAPGSGRLAVMASPMDNSPYVVVECLQARVPFLATKVGGIPELIHSEDRDTVLYEPNAKALAEKLRSILSLPLTGQAASPSAASSAPSPVPRFDPFVACGAHQSAEIAAQWIALHTDLAAALAHNAASDSNSNAPAATTAAAPAPITTAASAPDAPAGAIPQITRALFVSPPPRELTSRATASSSRDASVSVSRLPLVSVCVTHYHRPELLLHTLEALVAQSYPSSRMQVVIVDDGSTDPATLGVLEQQVEPFVRAQGPSWSLHRISNSYLGSARNQCRGWMGLDADFLLFLDDDDVPVVHMIAHLVQVALHTRAQILSTHFQLFWGKRTPKQIFHTQDDAADNTAADASSAPLPARGVGWPLFPRTSGPPLNALNRAPPALFAFVGSSLSLSFFSNTAGGANVFIRSCVFDALGGFSEYREVGFEDYELHVNAAVHRVHAEVIPAPLLLVRRHLKPRAAVNPKDGPQPALSMQSSTQPHLNRQRVITRFLDSFSHADASVDMAPLLQITWGMHDAQLRAAAGVGRAPSVSSAPAALELADSQRQFSGVQGQFGWWYALLILEGDSAATSLNPNLLRRPLQSHEQLSDEAEWAASGTSGDPPTLHTPRFFSASYLPQPFPHWGCAPHSRSLCPPTLRDASVQTWPHHTSASVHPAIVGGDAGAAVPLSVHTVRRWVSNFHGAATLRVSMQSEARQCGHGVVYALYLARNRIFTHDEQSEQKNSEATHASSAGPSGTIIDVSLGAESRVPGGSTAEPQCSLFHHVLTCVGVMLRVGTEVDLIVSPGINDWCDATNLIITIHTAT